MFPGCKIGLIADPVHLSQILATKLLPRIAIRFRFRLLFLFLLALQRVKAERFVRAHGVNVSRWIHKACASNGRAVIDDLVQRIVLISLSDVKDIDQAICARG